MKRNVSSAVPEMFNLIEYLRDVTQCSEAKIKQLCNSFRVPTNKRPNTRKLNELLNNLFDDNAIEVHDGNADSSRDTFLDLSNSMELDDDNNNDQTQVVTSKPILKPDLVNGENSDASMIKCKKLDNENYIKNIGPTPIPLPQDIPDAMPIRTFEDEPPPEASTKSSNVLVKKEKNDSVMTQSTNKNLDLESPPEASTKFSHVLVKKEENDSVMPQSSNKNLVLESSPESSPNSSDVLVKNRYKMPQPLNKNLDLDQEFLYNLDDFLNDSHSPVNEKDSNTTLLLVPPNAVHQQEAASGSKMQKKRPELFLKEKPSTSTYEEEKIQPSKVFHQQEASSGSKMQEKRPEAFLIKYRSPKRKRETVIKEEPRTSTYKEKEFEPSKLVHQQEAESGSKMQEKRPEPFLIKYRSPKRKRETVIKEEPRTSIYKEKEFQPSKVVHQQEAESGSKMQEKRPEPFLIKHRSPKRKREPVIKEEPSTSTYKEKEFEPTKVFHQQEAEPGSKMQEKGPEPFLITHRSPKRKRETVIKEEPSTSTSTYKEKEFQPSKTLQKQEDKIEEPMSKIEEPMSKIEEPMSKIEEPIKPKMKEEPAVEFPHVEEEPTANQKLILRMMEIFPDASRDFIKNLCRNKNFVDVDNMVTEVLSLESYPRRQERPPSPPKDYDIEEQLEIVKALLPDADPTYVRCQCEKFGRDTERLTEFINEARENKNYPTLKEYLRKQKLSAQSKQYTTEFNVEKFVELFPDPEKTFRDPSRQFLVDNYTMLYIVNFFQNRYDKLSRRIILLCLRKMNNNILASDDKMKYYIKKGEILRNRHKKAMLQDPPQNIAILQELAYLTHKEEIHNCIKQREQAEEEEKKTAKDNNLLNTCQCCFDDEVMPKATFSCPLGCSFCRSCIQKSCEIAMGDGKTDFKCLSGCSDEFTLQTLQKVLPPKLFSKLAQKKALAEVKAAGIKELESCPFCDFASIPNPADKVFRCLSLDCMKESCRLCKEENHIPYKCHEVEADADVQARVFVENQMTEALLRKCWSCNKSFFKEEGCNKMTCTCGAKMCYICNQPVKDYSHFNGLGGNLYHLCPLYSDTNDFNQKNVIKAAELAKTKVDPAKLKIDPSLDIKEHYERRKEKLPQEPHIRILQDMQHMVGAHAHPEAAPVQAAPVQAAPVQAAPVQDRLVLYADIEDDDVPQYLFRRDPIVTRSQIRRR